jgi:hypothetical protein
VIDEPDLLGFVRAVAAGDGREASRRFTAAPALATARLERHQELFIAECQAQIYAGDTALHAAAFAYDAEVAAALVAAGSDVAATNRRGAQPLHAAVIGAPGSAHWHPHRQAAVIAQLIDAGADPNATAAGGITPLHRAVRNRCAAAVGALLDGGADPRIANDHGSTAMALARWTTGRGGSGSSAAKAEQERIVALLAAASD